MPRIPVQVLHPLAQLPRYAHMGPHGDLAADLHSVARATLAPGETVVIPTGLALAFPEHFGGILHDRSSLALRGLHTLAGVIDPGYRGEIKVVLTNLGAETQVLEAGARIAQLRIVPLLQAEFERTEALTETERQAGGFGSTGI
jgi:dUTP pyrophosphatase